MAYLTNLHILSPQCILLGNSGDSSSDKELEADELEEILSKLKKSIQSDKRQSNVWNTLGVILLQSGRLKVFVIFCFAIYSKFTFSLLLIGIPLLNILECYLSFIIFVGFNPWQFGLPWKPGARLSSKVMFYHFLFYAVFGLIAPHLYILLVHLTWSINIWVMMSCQLLNFTVVKICKQKRKGGKEERRNTMIPCIC